jgi:4'-phosphopantetheinyl transferase EntD
VRAVALASGRHFLGIDIEPTTTATSAEPLAQVVSGDGPEDKDAS